MKFRSRSQVLALVLAGLHFFAVTTSANAQLLQRKDLYAAVGASSAPGGEKTKLV